MIAALILLIPATFFALRDSSAAAFAATTLWLIATLATIWVAFHLGTHPSDAGYLPNDVAAGTVLAMLGAAVGLAASLTAILSELTGTPARLSRHASTN